MEAVLSIAGSDSSGGAGQAADIKTIAAHRLFAERPSHGPQYGLRTPSA